MYISFLGPLTTVPCSWPPFYPFCLLSPLTLSGFFNAMLEVFEPGALNYFIFSRPTLSTLSAFRNPILTPLSEFLGSLLCVLIAPTPSLAFSLLMPHTLAAALSFSSGKAYPFRNFPPPLFLRLIPTLNMQGSTSLLTTPPLCHFLMCTRPLFAPLRRMAELIPSLPPFFPPPEIPSFWGTSIAITPAGEEVFDWVISSPSITLTRPLFSTASLAVAPLLTSPLLPPLFLFLAPGRCYRTWVLPPTKSSIRSSLSGLSPQRASPFLQFSESSLGWLCLLH